MPEPVHAMVSLVNLQEFEKNEGLSIFHVTEPILLKIKKWMRVTKFKPKEDPGTNKMGEQKYGVSTAGIIKTP